ncbi:preprotein translocase subunit SecF [Methanoculleus chikugoensis]|jgi:preprotein translocase subunit SecF|uniref:Protein-export membrane protein SecF n=1 Tax=Methanoculleus chikugoensis TaxID=118126 RepID=A0A1M4MLP3_9EURY|nr:protein translocase subunit SecF [Methanoculleus chikugoensis]MDD4566398.1 protein translocase subunit SecF [Methanoculleus chikugoensis]NMA11516.1 protein translocase subunit SecF [Methanomicrobiales archaeon]SCL75750.1 preprotein translocase subunit SecF [Methanoculleus chikugoensis]
MEFSGYDINKYSPRQMVALPLVLLLLAGVLLGYTMLTTGLPLTPGIDFAGGTAVTVFTSDSRETIEATFAGYPLLSVGEGVGNGKYIQFGPMGDDRFQSLTALINERYPDAKVDQIGETFGKTLQGQAFLAMIFSFIGMAVVVLIAFRSVVPAGAVVLAAFADIAITAGVMQIIGIPLSLGTTAALLMLIGYSVDSDILLTTRLLKRKGKLEEKLAGAFRTGIIMTTTTLAAIAAMWVVATAGQIQIISEIASVLLIGLFVDLMNTWMLNAGILKEYILRGNKR